MANINIVEWVSKWFATKEEIPTQTSDLTNDSNYISDPNYTHITVDDSLSLSSTNPIQNKVINNALNNKQDTLENTVTLKFTLENGEIVEHTFYEEL